VSRGSRQWLHRTGGHSTVEVAFDCLSALYISRGTREEMNPQFLLEIYQTASYKIERARRIPSVIRITLGSGILGYLARLHMARSNALGP
jgi:hypothetical protein